MRNRPPKDEQIELVIKGALPHLRRQMLFAHYPDFRALHQAGIRIEDEESQQPRNTFRRTSQTNTQSQNTYTRAAEVNRIQPNAYSPPFVNVINKPPRKYSNFNLPLSKVFQRLQQKDLLRPLEPRPIPNPLQPCINPNLYCHFHPMTSHNTDDCYILKDRIQDLIDFGKIKDPKK